MDDLRLLEEILSELEQIGITRIDGFFSYEKRAAPIRIVKGFGVSEQLKNLAYLHQDLKGQIVESLQDTGVEDLNADDKLLDSLLTIFIKFHEEMLDKTELRH